jgi:hypothetical protein
MTFNDLLLFLGWFSMNLSVDLGISEEFIITLHELASGFFIQTALWEGHDQQTLDDLENVR